MSTFCRVIILGNVGRDPEIRRMQDGKPVVNLSVATSETWKDKASGEKMEKTEWHRVVCFNEGLCRVMEQYVSKGSKILVEGTLQTRKWQDQSGQDRYSTEVVMGFNSTLKLCGDGKSRRDQGAGDRGVVVVHEHRTRPWQQRTDRDDREHHRHRCGRVAGTRLPMLAAEA